MHRVILPLDTIKILYLVNSNFWANNILKLILKTHRQSKSFVRNSRYDIVGLKILLAQNIRINYKVFIYLKSTKLDALEEKYARATA